MSNLIKAGDGTSDNKYDDLRTINSKIMDNVSSPKRKPKV